MIAKPRQRIEDLLQAFTNPRVFFAEDRAWHPLRAIVPHRHPLFQLDYFYAGQGTVGIAGKSYRVTPGDVFLIGSQQVHEFRAEREDPLKGISFKFRRAVRGKAVRLPVLLANLARFAAAQQRELHELLHRGAVEFNNGRSSHVEAAGVYLALFFILLERYLGEREQLSPGNAAPKVSEQVLDYLRRHYHEPLTLRDLGRAAGLHPGYLCQKFSEETGESPMARLARERVAAAQRLLMRTRLPIKQIGAQVGYPDIYHFSKRFKAIAGTSPNQYRARYRLDTVAALPDA